MDNQVTDEEVTKNGIFFERNIEKYVTMTKFKVDGEEQHVVTYYDDEENRYFSISIEYGNRVNNKDIEKSIELIIEVVIANINLEKHEGIEVVRSNEMFQKTFMDIYRKIENGFKIMKTLSFYINLLMENDKTIDVDDVLRKDEIWETCKNDRFIDLHNISDTTKQKQDDFLKRMFEEMLESKDIKNAFIIQ